ncbi:hypothetical protein ZIOFF_024628 [Zingiber officinale]|uniref:BEACH domain-containing protein n=1 Tax=Zingiber officinale TaxID=94328 RepID=A0A8J5HCT4_ZINOF|nr:hypothetical protein ZIOFF_024628 [Zingiber officinale]
MGKRRVAYSIVIRQHLIDDKNYLGLLPCLGHNHPLVIKQYKKWAASTSSFVVRDKAQWRSGLFPLENIESRKSAYRAIVQARPPHLNNIYLATQKPEQILKRTQLMERWARWEISNFEYLMELNTLAGRSYNDITQYPVFPWILADYSSKKLDLQDPATYRDLSKPIGALNPERLRKFQERYSSFEDPVIPKFHYGSHYSSAGTVAVWVLFSSWNSWVEGSGMENSDPTEKMKPWSSQRVGGVFLHKPWTECPVAYQNHARKNSETVLIREQHICQFEGYILTGLDPVSAVMYYLFRVEPFTTLSIQLQGGKFDHADRMFSDIGSTWDGVLEDMSDVKELVPEMFYLPEVLINVNSIDFGTTQLGGKLDAVKLPPWADNPVDFIHKHRIALESEHVSSHLHNWIDLIFGYKQRGKEAIEANNVFFYITYEGTVNVDKIEDPVQRRATQDQIAYFGQTPSQLLTIPHPRKRPLVDVLHLQQTVCN